MLCYDYRYRAFVHSHHTPIEHIYMTLVYASWYIQHHLHTSYITCRIRHMEHAVRYVLNSMQIAWYMADGMQCIEHLTLGPVAAAGPPVAEPVLLPAMLADHLIICHIIHLSPIQQHVLIRHRSCYFDDILITFSFFVFPF